MGLDLKKRKTEKQAETFPLAVTVGDDVLNIRYRRSSLTAGDVRRMKEGLEKANATDEDETLSIVERAKRNIEFFQSKEQQFLDMVTEWDLVSDGVPVPLTLDGLAEFDVDHPLIDLITEAIQEDQSPKPATGRS